ncbi:probable G-protein coupled receptor 141 [Osmerus mordax]|uniref:Probable G-protein coupled receptor 141 n=1 Tax=Osmerus mordax TaxID=8014 RepID=C1BM39_OSMMO|nr:Probable G-protein coupled receptor 141 [Osmerus mordax]
MSNDTDTDNNNDIPKEYRYSLVFLYSVVLVGGVISISLMINLLQSNMRSVTTTAVLNLIIVHILFLLTVPFRIYYYASGHWKLNGGLCKVVSLMIFAHIHLAFIFYCIILVGRYLTFFRRTTQMEFYRTLHAVGASLVVWALVLLIILPVGVKEYGSNSNGTSDQCFDFGNSLEVHTVKVLNYILSCIILIVTLAIAGFQVWILGHVYRTYRALTFSHQEFWAQMKSTSFVVVMVVCFVPYNLFRIYYVSQTQRESLDPINEILLAVTSLSCLDMLTLIGRPKPICGPCCT